MLNPKKSRKLKFAQSDNVDQEGDVHITKFRKLDFNKDVNTDNLIDNSELYNNKENAQDQSNIPGDHLKQHERKSSTSSSKSLTPGKVQSVTPAAPTRPANHVKHVSPPLTFMVSGQTSYRI